MINQLPNLLPINYLLINQPIKWLITCFTSNDYLFSCQERERLETWSKMIQDLTWTCLHRLYAWLQTCLYTWGLTCDLSWITWDLTLDLFWIPWGLTRDLRSLSAWNLIYLRLCLRLDLNYLRLVLNYLRFDLRLVLSLLRADLNYLRIDLNYFRVHLKLVLN